MAMMEVQSTRSAGRFPTGTAVLLLAFAALVSPAAAQELVGTFKGNGYGAISNGVKDTALAKQLHKLAYRPLPCGGTEGRTLVKSLSGVSIGSAGALMKATGVTSTIFTDKTEVSATMRSSSTLTSVNLFNGLITATKIGAVAEVDADAGKIVTSSADSSLEGLKINGTTIASSVTPGSTRALPFGTVTIKKFDKTGNGTSSQRLISDMLTINV